MRLPWRNPLTSSILKMPLIGFDTCACAPTHLGAITHAQVLNTLRAGFRLIDSAQMYQSEEAVVIQTSSSKQK